MEGNRMKVARDNCHPSPCLLLLLLLLLLQTLLPAPALCGAVPTHRVKRQVSGTGGVVINIPNVAQGTPPPTATPFTLTPGPNPTPAPSGFIFGPSAFNFSNLLGFGAGGSGGGFPSVGGFPAGGGGGFGNGGGAGGSFGNLPGFPTPRPRPRPPVGGGNGGIFGNGFPPAGGGFPSGSPFPGSGSNGNPTFPGSIPTFPGNNPGFPGNNNNPNFPGNNPNFPGNGPSFPSFPGNGPSFPTGPNFPGTNPDFPGSNPNFPGNNPSFPGNNPSFPGNNPSFPNYPGNGPNFPNLPPLGNGQFTVSPRFTTPVPLTLPPTTTPPVNVCSPPAPASTGDQVSNATLPANVEEIIRQTLAFNPQLNSHLNYAANYNSGSNPSLPPNTNVENTDRSCPSRTYRATVFKRNGASCWILQQQQQPFYYVACSCSQCLAPAGFHQSSGSTCQLFHLPVRVFALCERGLNFQTQITQEQISLPVTCRCHHTVPSATQTPPVVGGVTAPPVTTPATTPNVPPIVGIGIVGRA